MFRLSGHFASHTLTGSNDQKAFLNLTLSHCAARCLCVQPLLFLKLPPNFCCSTYSYLSTPNLTLSYYLLRRAIPKCTRSSGDNAHSNVLNSSLIVDLHLQARSAAHGVLCVRLCELAIISRSCCQSVSRRLKLVCQLAEKILRSEISEMVGYAHSLV